MLPHGRNAYNNYVRPVPMDENIKNILGTEAHVNQWYKEAGSDLDKHEVAGCTSVACKRAMQNGSLKNQWNRMQQQEKDKLVKMGIFSDKGELQKYYQAAREETYEQWKQTTQMRMHFKMMIRAKAAKEKLEAECKTKKEGTEDKKKCKTNLCTIYGAMEYCTPRQKRDMM